MTDRCPTRTHGEPVRLRPSELDGSPDKAAVALLGCLLRHDHPDGTRSVARIVETEAYGPADPASHSYRGPTPRCASMFAAPGTAYVYRSYGVHHCLNVSAGPAELGAAVLLRGAIVIAGEKVVRRRRPDVRSTEALLRGPGNLSSGMDVEVARHDGSDLLAGSAGLSLWRDAYGPEAGGIASGPRVGVSRAADVASRYVLTGAPGVSRYRRSPRA